MPIPRRRGLFKGRSATVVSWGLAGFWALWALIRLTGFERGFPLVPLISYTPYMAVATVVPLAVALALRRWIPALLAAVAGMYFVFALLPRALPDGSASEPLGGPQIKVLSANLFRGHSDPKALMELVRIRDVDILTVQELTPRAASKLRRQGIEQMLPEAVLAIRGDVYGGGIYSRFPLSPLTPAPGTTFSMPRADASVPGFGDLRLVSVHPFPPSGWTSVGKWKDGLRSLPAAGGEGRPWLLAGDFNATFDHAEFRSLLDTGYRDAADVNGDGFTTTWPARGLLPPPVTIDHVLADEQLAIIDYSVEDLPGSDHRPVFAVISLPRPGRGGA
jgi:endonuclease/exonuclease/phosphatase family metal-dependent hydrolase